MRAVLLCAPCEGAVEGTLGSSLKAASCMWHADRCCQSLMSADSRVPPQLVETLAAIRLFVPWSCKLWPSHALCQPKVTARSACAGVWSPQSLCMCVEGLAGAFVSGQHSRRPTQRQLMIKPWCCFLPAGAVVGDDLLGAVPARAVCDAWRRSAGTCSVPLWLPDCVEAEFTYTGVMSCDGTACSRTLLVVLDTMDRCEAVSPQFKPGC